MIFNPNKAPAKTRKPQNTVLKKKVFVSKNLRHQTPSNPANKHHTATRTFQLLIFVGLPSSWMLWPRKLCILSPPPSTPGGGVAAVWRKGMVGAKRAGETHLNFSRALNPGGLAKGLCWEVKRCQVYKTKWCDLLI